VPRMPQRDPHRGSPLRFLRAAATDLASNPRRRLFEGGELLYVLLDMAYHQYL
jgi:hypothetical protein